MSNKQSKAGAELPRSVEITEEFVTLGQALKLAGVVMTGGEVKGFLEDNPALINGEADQRRGRKLRVGDVVNTAGVAFRIVEGSPVGSEDSVDTDDNRATGSL